MPGTIATSAAQATFLWKQRVSCRLVKIFVWCFCGRGSEINNDFTLYSCRDGTLWWSIDINGVLSVLWWGWLWRKLCWWAVSLVWELDRRVIDGTRLWLEPTNKHDTRIRFKLQSSMNSMNNYPFRISNIKINSSNFSMNHESIDWTEKGKNLEYPAFTKVFVLDKSTNRVRNQVTTFLGIENSSSIHDFTTVRFRKKFRQNPASPRKKIQIIKISVNSKNPTSHTRTASSIALLIPMSDRSRRMRRSHIVIQFHR